MIKLFTLIVVFSISVSIVGSTLAQDVARDSGNSNQQRDRSMRQKQDDIGPQKRRRNQGQRRQQGKQQDGPDLAKLFQRLDKNNDGKITADEVQGRMAERMSKIDQNGDGVDRAELMAAFRNRRNQRGPQERDEKGQGGMGQDRNFIAILQRADKNGDGKLSKDEAPDRMKQRFDQIDANGDGTIDVAELKEIASKLKNGAGIRGQGKDGGNKPQKPKRPGGIA